METVIFELISLVAAVSSFGAQQDPELRSYAAALVDLVRLERQVGTMASAPAQQEADRILARHDLTRARFNALSQRVRTEPQLRNQVHRLAAEYRVGI